MLNKNTFILKKKAYKDIYKFYIIYNIMNKDIIFFWIQGSGKWTQANIFLDKNNNYKYLEPGNIFRALSSNSNLISNYVTSRIQAWKLVEDKLVFWLFDLCTSLLEWNEYLLLDWFPRNLAQKDYFLTQRKKLWRDFIAINFNLSREQAIERIKKRAVDQWRADDAKEEVIAKRLDTFEEETLPVIKSLEAEWKLITIDANQSIEDIYNELIDKLN